MSENPLFIAGAIDRVLENYVAKGDSAAAFRILSSAGVKPALSTLASLAKFGSEQFRDPIIAMTRQRLDGLQSTDDQRHAISIAETYDDDQLLDEVSSFSQEEAAVVAPLLAARVRCAVKRGGSYEELVRILDEFADNPGIGSDDIVSLLPYLPSFPNDAQLQRIGESLIALVKGAPSTALLIRLANRRFVNGERIEAVARADVETNPDQVADNLIALIKVNAKAALGIWRENNSSILAGISLSRLSELTAAALSVFDDNDWRLLLEAVSGCDQTHEAAPLFLELLVRRQTQVGDAYRFSDFILTELRDNHDDAGYLLRLTRVGSQLQLWRDDNFASNAEILCDDLQAGACDICRAILLVLQDERRAAYEIVTTLQCAPHDPMAEVITELTRGCGVYKFSPYTGVVDTAHVVDDVLSQSLYTPQSGERLLVIAERGADPGPILSCVDSDVDVTYCSMDNWEGKYADKADRYWSLRDLFLDADPLARELTYSVRQIAEYVASFFSVRQSIALDSEKRRFAQRPLAIALEDAVEGAVVNAFCMLRAIEKFDGDSVIFALADPSILENFADEILASGKKVCACFAKPNATSSGERFVKLITPQIESQAAAPLSLHEIGDFLRLLDSLSFEKFVSSAPNPKPGSVLLMGAFGDHIYTENIIPTIQQFLKDRDVHVLEPLSVGHCRAALENAFGIDLSRTQSSNALHIVDASAEIAGAMRKFKNIAAVLDRICDDALAGVDPTLFQLGDYNIKRFLERNITAFFRKSFLRFELCMKLYEELFSAHDYEALFVFSERLPVRMSAVAVAREQGVKSVDVMSVNAVRLPRYRPPKADILTSMDTLTSDFFRDFYGAPENRIALTGSPRMDFILDKIRGSDPAETKAYLDISDDVKVILYACQLQPIDRCISIMNQLVKVVEQRDDVILIAKLHRRENFARERAYEAAAVSSLAFNRIRLVRDDPYLNEIAHSLRVADVVVSMYSNALREAACVGVPFVAADYFETSLPFDYSVQGLGYKAKSEDELFDQVFRIIESGVDPFYNRRRQEFFEKNPQLLNRRSAELIAALV